MLESGVKDKDFLIVMISPGAAAKVRKCHKETRFLAFFIWIPSFGQSEAAPAAPAAAASQA